jgi:hypothetical protein
MMLDLHRDVIKSLNLFVGMGFLSHESSVMMGTMWVVMDVLRRVSWKHSRVVICSMTNDDLDITIQQIKMVWLERSVRNDEHESYQ